MRQLIFRKNYHTGLMHLDPDKRLEVYDAIMLYAFENKKTEVSPECKPILAIILESINADFRRYERAKENEYGRM